MDKIAALLMVLALPIGFLSVHLAARQEGADTACATTKECPSGFEAKWVEAGCLCVPSSKARH